MPDGMLIRFLLPPAELHTDYPTGNILVANMEERNIDDFTSSNINYLEANMPGVTILDKGVFNAAGAQGRWFTYTKVQNGIKRDMINYIIPSNGFAYMVTFGSNQGSFNKYRRLFDDIARSVKG